MVALRSQGNWRWKGPLGTPLGLEDTLQVYELGLAQRPFSEWLKQLVQWLLLSVLHKMALVTWKELGMSCLSSKIIYVFKKFGHQPAEVIMV